MDSSGNKTASVHGGGSLSEPNANLVAHTVTDSLGQSNVEQESQVKSAGLQSFSEALKKKVASKTIFPKEDQAIILTSITGIPIKDYIVNLSEVVGPENIQFASKISHNRVCVYLSSKQCVDDFMIHHGGIPIGDVFVSARRLITPASRIVISNVPPHIPHEVVESTLKDSNLKVVSPVSYVGMGLGLPKLHHVCSFRRQVYIVLNENKDLPSSVMVSGEGKKHRIFLSTDEIKCFVCRNSGHISKNCPNLNEEFPPIPATSSNADKSGNTEAYSGPVGHVDDTSETEVEKEAAVSETNPRAESTGLKRLASTEIPEDNQEQVSKQHLENVASGDSSTQSVPVPQISQVRSKSKRLKSSKSMLNESLEPLKQVFEQKKFVLNFEEFKSFLKSVKGSNEPKQVALKYTTEIPQLIQMIQDLLPSVEVRSLKERCRRLTVSLTKGRRSGSRSGLTSSELSE